MPTAAGWARWWGGWGGHSPKPLQPGQPGWAYVPPHNCTVRGGCPAAPGVAPVIRWTTKGHWNLTP